MNIRIRKITVNGYNTPLTVVFFAQKSKMGIIVFLLINPLNLIHLHLT